MAQSIEFTKRQLGRAKATAKAAIEGNNAALAVLAKDFLPPCEAFFVAEDASSKAAVAASKEVSEGTVALGALGRVFDATREVVASKLNITFEAASSFGTADDLLNAAEEMEGHLETAEGEWAPAVLVPFSAALESATKEYSEGSDAQKVAQKAVTTREQATGNARPLFVRFRRGVRTAFGSKSREYRELLDRRSRGSDPDPEPTT